MPSKAAPSWAVAWIPSAAKSFRASGIRPSPHALSIGGRRASATRTSKPFCRKAMAAARPAGPPPAISASQRITRALLSLPFQQQHLRTETGPHGGQDAARPGLRAATIHDLIQDYEH